MATAAATAAAFAEDSASKSSALGTRGLAGLNTGAAADILDALGGGVAEVCAERRFDASDILKDGEVVVEV